MGGLVVSVFNWVWWLLIALAALGAALVGWLRALRERRISLSGAPDGEALLARHRDVNKKIVLWFAVFCVIYIVYYRIRLFLAPGYEFNIWNELPLHICNVVSMLAIPAVLCEGKAGHIMKAYCFHCGILGAFLAMMIPDLDFVDVGLLTAKGCYYIFHSLVVSLALCFGTLKLYEPRYRDLPATAAALLGTTLAAHGLNWLLRATVLPEANYFYTYGLPGNAVLEPLKKLIPINFVYELPLLAVVFAGGALLVLAGRLAARLFAAAGRGGRV